jgi:hypothetical protein
MRFLIPLFIFISNCVFSQNSDSFISTEVKWDLIEYFTEKKSIIIDDPSLKEETYYTLKYKVKFYEEEEIDDIGEYLLNLLPDKKDACYIVDVMVKKFEEGDWYYPTHAFGLDIKIEKIKLKKIKKETYKGKYNLIVSFKC